MNALEPLVGEARERLVARAKREGLVTVAYDVMDSPLGPIWIAVGPRGVVNIHYGATPDPRELSRITHAYGPGVLPDRRGCDRVLTELDQYFAGRRRSFDVVVDLATLTPFQQRILAATARVPYGELTTYKVVARQAGNEQAARAAGAALRANPIPIVVPCHRIVATDGTLGGYAGGLAAKRRLLTLERGTTAVPDGGWEPSRR
jgi:methylated-DNA-[protein]-cysteine S-methyltransferase